MKEPTPAPVILLRLFCIYLMGTALRRQLPFFSSIGEYGLEWLLESPLFAIQTCMDCIVPFTLLYCSLKPSKTALIAIQTLFSLHAVHAFFSLASAYAQSVDMYGYEDTKKMFSPWSILSYLAEVSLLFLFFVNKRISGWFYRHGLKETAHERR